MVAVAVISTIASLAMFGLGGLREDAAAVKSQRNAQTVASMFTAASQAGAVFTSAEGDVRGVVGELIAGKTLTGSLRGRTVSISPLTPREIDLILPLLRYNRAAQTLTFIRP